MTNHPNRNRRRTAAIAEPVHDHLGDYAAFLSGIQETFESRIAGGGRLFATNATGLFDAFLDHLPDERQIHACSSCRQFFKAFGGLVTIARDGEAIPAMWDIAPAFYHASILAMTKIIRGARVTAPFLAKQTTWGTPVTGDWSHASVRAPGSLAFRHMVLTPKQAMAAKREDFKTVATALADFTAPMLTEALRILKAEVLRGSEKFVAPIQWLFDLHTVRSAVKDGRTRDNLLWRAIADAPEGYCHPRASVTGALLEDIAAGLAFNDIKARFDAKMHPLMYQRPQAAPSAGNIAHAEKLVETLGIAPSLERRFARLEDCETLWTPRAPKAAPIAVGGVFAHLSPKADAMPSVDLPRKTMTWVKFVSSVMPNAEAMEMLVPAAGNFIALTAAANADAPPILKWDREDRRNTVAWYVYHGGSPASQWGLTSNRWHPLTAMVDAPPMWGDRPMPHLAGGLALIIQGAADMRTGQGNALFPEDLRQELHAARSTIEAYSRRAEMQGREEASACGFGINKGSIGCLLRVAAGGHKAEYHIDRWD